MSIIRKGMKQSWKDVYYEKKYHVDQNEEHFTLTAADGSVIEFDWYYADGGQVFENVKGTTRSIAGVLVYMLWFQVN